MDKKDYPVDFEPNGQGKMRKWYVWIFIVLLAALILWTMAGDKISHLFNSLLAGLTPVIIAMVISFLFLKPMQLIENKLLKNAFAGSAKGAKIKRVISLTMLYLITIGILVAVIVFSVPSIITMVQQFTDQEQLTALLDKVHDMIVQVVQFFGISAESAAGAADTVIAAVNDFIVNFTASINIENVFGIISSVTSALMGFLIAFFILKDKELIAKTCRRYTYAYYPRRKAEEVINITRRTNEMMNQYVVSTLIVCFTVGAIGFIGYAIMGVPYAFLMALLLAILSIIPYIGGFIAAVPLLMFTLMAGDLNMFFMAFVFTIAEWAIVTTFLPPLVMSKRMNTRTLVILLALIIGGAMFGVIGMILSAPIASVISIVMNEKLQAREALREHEELVEAGIIDENFYDISEMLDLTQDNANEIVIEKEEDEFKKLQSLKNKEPKLSLESDIAASDVVVSSKSSKKAKQNKKALTEKIKSNDGVSNKVKEARDLAHEILEETDNTME